jgi:hypothetical protein
MIRFLFWLIVLLAAVLVLEGAVPLPGIAPDEVVYTTTPPVSTCGSSGCIAVYTLEVANVGRARQDAVRVRLRTDVLRTPVIAPTVRRASEAVLAATANDQPGIDLVPLGALAPEERVALVFAVRAPSRDAIVGWDRILVDVEPGMGAARPGDVAAITVGRVVHAVGRVVHRVLEAVRQAIAAS